MTAPVVDVLTDRVAVVVQDRPVVPLSTWLSDVLAQCVEGDLGLQVVSPPRARLTLPLRAALARTGGQWVVGDAAGGYYDGRSGAVLHWDGGAFVPTVERAGEPSLAAAFAPAGPPPGVQLAVSLCTRHPATDRLVLGGAVEAVARALAGGPPAAWGSAEPAASRWSRTGLTELCRRRAPRRSWLVVAGGADRPLVATLVVRRTTAGVEEQVDVGVGYSDGEPVPLGALADLAAELVVGHALDSMLVQRCPGRPDLTTPPRWEGLPVPVGLALGPAATREISPDRLRRIAGQVTSRTVGGSGRLGTWFEFGDGLAVSAWQGLERLVGDLRGDPS